MGLERCMYPFVLCDSDGYELDLRDYDHLEGTLSHAIGNCSGLSRLTLGNQTVSGTIPTELGRLSKLDRLSMGNNSLNGTVPTELGSLRAWRTCTLRIIP